jgi:uncharacterized membrane protein
MALNTTLSEIRLGNRQAYSLLVQFPAVCFVGALVCDITYWRTALFMWETFSVWLLAAGCVMSAAAGMVGLVYFLTDARVRTWRLAWAHALISLLAAVLSVVNAFVHSRDGYTAVVPTGLALSIVVVLLMVLAASMGWTHDVERASRVGVAA